MKRREVLLSSLALPLGAALLWQGRGIISPNSEGRAYTPLCSAAYDGHGGCQFGATQSGKLAFSLSSHERGHDSCVHPARKEALFFARRPGTHVYITDLHSGELKQTIQAQDGFHFYGHGCLGADGRTLYTTENHVAGDGRGAIGCYDSHDGYRYLGHIDCGGIGPHELALMPDGEHLVVAVGGLKTLPDSGRKTLNPETLEPGLSYIHLPSGAVAEFVPSPHPQLSLRHLDVNAHGDVVVGAQFQGPRPSTQPLLYHHRRGSSLRALDPQRPLPMRHDYVASVALDDSGQALCSFPLDNQFALWSIAEQRLIQSWQLRDCAGAVYDPQYRQFVISSSTGQLVAVRAGERTPRQLAYLPEFHWDNHLSLIGAELASQLPTS